ncbi:hypothetical protein HGRIS_000728 [Hohenbuehelia grisea]|uniref:N-acetyltransferase domain-containing protein n=1 Tax=Hohenbuehelia grisea TaxID=104357 RepID=A0ABR3IPJ0_9AGAR
MSSTTPTYTIRLFTNPSGTEVAAAEQVLADAFKGDNFTEMTVGRDPALVLPFGRSVLTAGLLEGTVYVAEDSTGTIAAVAVWFGPGTEYCHTELQQEKALKPLLSQLIPELQVWWSDQFLGEYNQMISDALGSEDALLNSWHLQLIGVNPEHQRRGLAGKIIKLVREKAHAEGYAVTLEPTTEIKRQVYERMGFATKGHHVFRAPKDLGESPMWSMIYSPPSGRT